MGTAVWLAVVHTKHLFSILSPFTDFMLFLFPPTQPTLAIPVFQQVDIYEAMDEAKVNSLDINK